MHHNANPTQTIGDPTQTPTLADESSLCWALLHWHRFGVSISCCLFPVPPHWIANANAFSGGIRALKVIKRARLKPGV